MEPFELQTPHGPARVHLQSAQDPRGAVILGHGAGGGVAAVDLQAAAQVAGSADFSVALVEQPYRVAGRRAPAPAGQLDAAFGAVVGQLCERDLEGLPVVVGGRSMGARVACRTAAGLGAIGVLCLAFPLLPPARAASARPPQSRLPELDAVTVACLVVQGEQDRFGMPPQAPGRTVVRVPGDHSLRRGLPALRTAVQDWLEQLEGI